MKNLAEQSRPRSLVLLAGCGIAALVAPSAASPRLGDGCGSDEVKLLAHDGGPWDKFGAAVALQGSTAIVSCWGEASNGPQGCYVFADEGAGWSEQGFIRGSDAGSGGGGASPVLAGERLVFGDPNHDHLGNDVDTGSAYVFVRSGAGWTEEAELLPGDPHDEMHFGLSLALGGARIVVGAPGPPVSFVGSAHVFVFDGTSWIEEAKLVPSGPDEGFGRDVAISGDWIAVGAGRPFGYPDPPGEAYVFRRTAAGWVQHAKLQGENFQGDDDFGLAIAMEGTTLFVGAPKDSESAGAGAVYVYELEGSEWAQRQKLFSIDADGADFFGISLALQGDSALIGAHREHDYGYFPGSAYWFVREDGRWRQQQKIRSSSGWSGAEFGASVAISGDLALIGAPNDDDVGFSSGSASVFRLQAPPGTVYCTCETGPCGNSHPGAGCANSTGGGALLTAEGRTLPDEVNLLVTGARPHQWAILVQGDQASQSIFGDGYRCASGGIVRFTAPPLRIGAAGTLAFGPCFGDPSISSLTGVVPGSGTTARYQCWYRDAAGPCGSSFNLTNGYEITW